MKEGTQEVMGYLWHPKRTAVKNERGGGFKAERMRWNGEWEGESGTNRKQHINLKGEENREVYVGKEK